MQTINSKPNFTGYYRISKPTDNIKCCTEEIRLLYRVLKGKQIAVISGDYPFAQAFDNTYNNIANEEGYCLEWLRQNARNHGVSIPEPNNDSITFITTQKDISDLVAYIETNFKKISKCFTPFSRLKFKLLALLHIGNDADLPLYLKIVKHIASSEQNSIDEFEKYFINKNIINLTSKEDLIEKLLSEKV